ncbi:hypothetical protein [Streptomyces sp. YKOK-I1]
MVRIPLERGFGARLEPRPGDASAHPYLLIAGAAAAALLPPVPSAALDALGADTAKSSAGGLSSRWSWWA